MEQIRKRPGGLLHTLAYPIPYISGLNFEVAITAHFYVNAMCGLIVCNIVFGGKTEVICFFTRKDISMRLVVLIS